MAICLRNSFRSCRSFVFVCKRTLQTNFLDEKVGCSDHSLLTMLRNYHLHSPMVESLQDPPCNSFQWGEQSSVYVSKYAFDFESNTKFHSLLFQKELVFCAKECKAYKEDIQKDPDNTPGRPDPGQVQYVFQVLSEDLPKLFSKALDYRIYHPNMIFENNIRGTKTIGLSGYITQIALLKTVAHIKFAKIKFDVLKMTAHPEDGTVRVRWRIRGISNYKAFFSFIKWSSAFDLEKEAEGWYDGFSVFYVRSDGLVHKHTVDKMMPDSEEKVSSIIDPLAAKTAFVMGLTLKDFSSPSVYYKEEEVFEITYPLEKLELLSNEMQFYFSEVVNKSGLKN